MDAEMLHLQSTPDDHHAAKPGEQRTADCDCVAEGFAAVRKQDDQKKRQHRREWDQPNQCLCRHLKYLSQRVVI